MNKIEKIYKREVKSVLLPALLVILGVWLVVSVLLLSLVNLVFLE